MVTGIFTCIYIIHESDLDNAASDYYSLYGVLTCIKSDLMSCGFMGNGGVDYHWS